MMLYDDFSEVLNAKATDNLQLEMSLVALAI